MSRSSSASGERMNLPTRLSLLYSFAQLAKGLFSLDPFPAIKTANPLQKFFLQLVHRGHRNLPKQILFLQQAKPFAQHFARRLKIPAFDLCINEAFPFCSKRDIHSSSRLTNGI